MDYKNQIGLFNPEEFEHYSVTIIGVGAIGSITSLVLTKMGLKNINAYDKDTIENHNIPNQFYKQMQIGEKKTSALKMIVNEFTEGDITENGNINENTIIVSDMVIVCTDNMVSRKLAYDKAKEFAKYFIDARMSGETYRIYTFDLNNPKHCELYEKSLYSDKESDEGPCTEKTIIYNVVGIAGMICSNVRKLLMNVDYSNFIAYDFRNDLLIKRNW